MEEIVQRFLNNLVGRVDGPLHFRFIIQPLVAVIYAVIDGLEDAKWGQPAYFWALFGSAEHRRALLKDGWKHFGKVFIIGVVLDVIYQLKVQGTLYPGETLVVALVLAVVPYVLLRGPVNRIAKMFKK